MVSFKNTLKKWLPTKRRLMQLYFALLFNANVGGFASGNIYRGGSKQFCVPGLNCYSCPGAVGACPLGSLQGAFSADRSTLFYVGGIIVLYGILFGRMICGWLCPFGLIQELLYKIPTVKLKKSPVTRLLSCLKYVLLAVFVFLIPILYALKDTPLPAFCKYICPAGTIEGGLTLLANEVNASYFSMLGPIFTWKFLLTVSIVTGCIFVFRLFCRFLCPLGALYGLFNRLSFFGMKLEAETCIDCGRCVSHCKVDIRHVGDRECVSCGECIEVCPTQAISWKGGRVRLKENDIPPEAAPRRRKLRLLTRTVTAALMLAVLTGALVYYGSGSTAPLSPGSEVGDLAYGCELEVLTSQGVSGETIDPTRTGRLTVINFWGTWCTPCVEELPYFDRIASEYRDSVTVIAVHTSLVSETAPEYIGKYYPQSDIIFALDGSTDETGLTGGFYSALGGRGTYPYTVILDETGKIVSIFHSSLEYADLKEAVDAHLAR